MCYVVYALTQCHGTDMSATMTIRLDDKLKAQLDQIADATQRSKSFLAREAIREFIKLNEWQVQRIQQSENPALGHPDRIDGTRELDVPNTCHIIPYRVKPRMRRVEILRVFHSSRENPRQST